MFFKENMKWLWADLSEKQLSVFIKKCGKNIFILRNKQFYQDKNPRVVYN